MKKIRYREKKAWKARLFGEVGIWILVLINLVPIYLLIQIGLKTAREFAANPYGLPNELALSNLADAWKGMKMPLPIINSLIIAGSAVLGTVLVSALAAYAIARSKAKWTKYIYMFFLFGMMVNFQIIMIPLYKLMRDLNLPGVHLGVIFIYIALCMGFSVLVFTGFIKSIPSSLDEAAKIDGAGKLRIFFQIIFPLLKPATVSVIVFNAVWIWNDLLMPLLFMGGRNPTIITALYNFKGQNFTTDWTMVFAGSIISILPLVIVFLFLQKYFIKGMAAAAIKG